LSCLTLRSPGQYTHKMANRISEKLHGWFCEIFPDFEFPKASPFTGQPNETTNRINYMRHPLNRHKLNLPIENGKNQKYAYVCAKPKIDVTYCHENLAKDDGGQSALQEQGMRSKPAQKTQFRILYYISIHRVTAIFHASRNWRRDWRLPRDLQNFQIGKKNTWNCKS